MRRPSHIVAPALVVGALFLGGYRFALHPGAAPGAASAPAARAAAVAAVLPATATGTAVLPTAIVEPTNTLEPAAMPTATNTPEPTATATATNTPLPTATFTPMPTATPQPAPPDRIVAPAIGLDSRVVTVGWHEVTNPDGTKSAEWDVASYAAGWHKNSAKPGQVGNVVLSGHNNIEGEVFRNLERFQVGDTITLYAGGRTFNYTVTEKFTLLDKGVSYEQRIQNAKWIGQFADERLTLVSCWPPTNNTHRIFIIAKPKK